MEFQVIFKRTIHSLNTWRNDETVKILESVSNTRHFGRNYNQKFNLASRKPQMSASNRTRCYAGMFTSIPYLEGLSELLGRSWNYEVIARNAPFHTSCFPNSARTQVGCITHPSLRKRNSAKTTVGGVTAPMPPETLPCLWDGKTHHLQLNCPQGVYTPGVVQWLHPYCDICVSSHRPARKKTDKTDTQITDRARRHKSDSCTADAGEIKCNQTRVWMANIHSFIRFIEMQTTNLANAGTTNRRQGCCWGRRVYPDKCRSRWEEASTAYLETLEGMIYRDGWRLSLHEERVRKRQDPFIIHGADLRRLSCARELNEAGKG